MIRIEELTHTFASRWRRGAPVRALDRLSLQLSPGSSVGLVGLNGAGKTTLIRLLLGYLRPTSGTLTIDAQPPRSYVERFGVAYVPERVAIPRHWTVETALSACALLGNVDQGLSNRVDAALSTLGLEPLRGRSVGALSKGNLQRLAIAQAVLYDRRVMILDEPTDGLDPLWIARLRGIIHDWHRADPRRIVLLASHDLPFVEAVVDRVVVLHRGRLHGEVILTSEHPPLEDAFLSMVGETVADAARVGGGGR